MTVFAVASAVPQNCASYIVADAHERLPQCLCVRLLLLLLLLSGLLLLLGTETIKQLEVVAQLQLKSPFPFWMFKLCYVIAQLVAGDLLMLLQAHA